MKKSKKIIAACCGALCVMLAACGQKAADVPGSVDSVTEVTEAAGKEEVVAEVTETVTETEAVEVTEETEMVAETEEQETGTEEKKNGKMPEDAEAEAETKAQGQEQAETNPGVEAGSAQNGAASGQTADGSYSGTENVYLDSSWEYADHTVINSGYAVLYTAEASRKNLVVGVNAGHGTSGGTSVKTLCHPDGSAKTTGGTTGQGATQAVAVSSGMTFQDGTAESSVTLRMAQILRDKLLAAGYDVLMVRDGSDVQLDNIARTVICNNRANCHIALHWDGDGLDYDKGCFYIRVPDGIKGMEPVASHWQQHDALGAALVEGLRGQGAKINGKGSMAIDLTQTSYSTVPSVDMELGNACSDHSDATLGMLADGLVAGVNSYFGQ